MWVFLIIFFLIPGSLSVCPEPVTGSNEFVTNLGSCLYIPCRYDLCQAGPDPQLRQLRWLHRPRYNKELKRFTGREVAQPRATSETPNRGDCSLVLPHLRAEDAGQYGLRLVAHPTRHYYKELLWMHLVTVNLTDTPPAPHLWPEPSPLTQGRRTTIGCWVPLPCPEETPTLTWEGPATKTAGAYVDPWTPPATVTSSPVIGTAFNFEPFWYHDDNPLDCVLRAADGKVITRVSRWLQVNFPPRNVQVEVMTSSPVTEGEEVTLRCHDSANPPSHIYTWSLDGRVLPHTAAQVLLKPVQATDGGNYSCEATNIAGTTKSAPAFLEVYSAPRAARVELTPPSPVREGQEVTLTCRVTSHPPPHTYLWSLGGRFLPHSGGRLVLRPVRETDGGSYGCQATNPLGTSTSLLVTLEVYFPPRSAILEIQPPPPALLGTRLTLLCHFGSAHPAPSTVQWLRDDRWEADTPGPALSFHADPARAGAYRCLARNPAGSALSPPLVLSVWYPPREVRVVQSPRGSVVAGGGPVRFRCEVGAAQPPEFEVKWFKNGQELPGPAPDLLLPRPQPADAAAYVCQAQNEAGATRSPPVTLDVRFAPRGVELAADPAPRVPEGTDVTLRCRARAQPPPSAFRWFRDGRPLGQTPKGFWVLGVVEVGAAGRYQCRVINDVAAVDSDDVIVDVYYSTATIIRKTFLALAVGLSLLLLSATLGCFLRRRCRRPTAADEEPVVQPSGTFFLRRKKPLTPRSPPSRPRDTDDISYASLLSPSGVDSVPRLRGDAVVYTVLKRNDGAPKATEGPDYENVPAGPSHGDKEGTLVYAALALSSPGRHRGGAGEGGDSVEYAALRH